MFFSPTLTQLVKELFLECFRSALTYALVMTLVGLALHTAGLATLGGAAFLLACALWAVVLYDVFNDMIKD